MGKKQTTQTPLLTLDDLAEKLPKPDAHLRASLVEEHTRADFIAQGRKIASSRIVLDEQSLLNEAYQFFESATAEQKATLVGFTPALLAIAVDEARKLTTMAASASAAAQATSAASAASNAAAARTYARASALRNQAVTVLKKVAAHDAEWTQRIDAAHANADVATALAQLAATGDAMLADKKSSLHARATLHALTTSYLDTLRAGANDASSATAAHVGRRRPTSQGALDLEDGINLHVLGAIIDAFDAAHDLDATIPRLVPISTRNLLGSHHHAAPAPGPAPTPPVTAPTSP